MIYGNFTSPELKKRAADHIALLPLAAVEQHGNHLPVITDTALVTEVAIRVEQALSGQVLLLPTFWAGSSHHHLGFPGTMSLSHDTYVLVLCDLIRSLLNTGFRRIMLLNGHGGNVIPANTALYKIMLEQPKGTLPWIAASSYWTIPANKDYSEFMETPKLTHACEYETSMMMALRTDWVDLSLAQGERVERHSKFYDPLGYEPSRVMISESFAEMTSTGAMGKPECSTPEKGERLFAHFAAASIEFLKEFATWQFRERR